MAFPILSCLLQTATWAYIEFPAFHIIRIDRITGERITLTDSQQKDK